MQSSHINSKLNAIWRKLRNKEYRGSFVASQISNTIAAQIFSLREARGWTQVEVAAKAGMKQSRISDLEDPNYENYETRTLVKLASAYDVGLVVRFAPFSELAKLSTTLSPRDFLPTEFSKDGIVQGLEDINALGLSLFLNIDQSQLSTTKPIFQALIAKDQEINRLKTEIANWKMACLTHSCLTHFGSQDTFPRNMSDPRNMSESYSSPWVYNQNTPSYVS